MGVLSDGTPYLHLRGLAKVCGVDHSVLQRLAANWAEERAKPRGVKIQELLNAQGFVGATLALRTNGALGETLAFTDPVCMAILEYYAFDATQANDTGVALRNYRQLARSSFRHYIYKRCGYDPERHIPESWRTFHERILLNDQVPVGYFSIFREVADLVVHMVRAGCHLDSHTVPDGSVGIAWAAHWVKHNLTAIHGERFKSDHYYPDWFPQAAANPVPAWVYPVQAMGEFRTWLYEKYLPTAFPKYIENKVKQGAFLPGSATTLIAAMQRPAAPQLRGPRS